MLKANAIWFRPRVPCKVSLRTRLHVSRAPTWHIPGWRNVAWNSS
jgi:hypothetical protein